MKLWERIIEHRLRGVTNVTEIDYGCDFLDKATYGEM
jgi:hypothetical protein